MHLRIATSLPFSLLNLKGLIMVTIIRHEVNESLAISGVVETRGLVFVSYCLGNIGKPIEEQINGAFDNLSERLNAIGLTLE